MGKWLEGHLPELAAALRPGATEDRLERFARSLGVELPDDFRQLYAWHDGQERTVLTGPWYGLDFLSLERVESHCAGWSTAIQHLGSDLDGGMKSTPPGFVRRQYANPLWIPFAFDWGGNHLGIDLDPDELGTWGQVITFGRDEDRKIAVAPSLEVFVGWMVQQLQDGNFRIKGVGDGQRWLHTLRPDREHFLDSLALLFPDS